MRVVAITLEDFFPGEARAIEAALDGGYDLVHLRKPGASEQEIISILEELPAECRARIVLHSHFNLAARYGLYGIHLNSRCSVVPDGFLGSISRSCHTLEEVEQYKGCCNYLFLSPIFDSISKKGYASAFSDETLKRAAEEGVIDSRVYALGGVTPERLSWLEELGFGGAAMLGSVWGKLVTPPVVLTIAGSDSSGGAGIQADIKAISANGCYAASAITAITAQNTCGVTDILGLPPELVGKQISAVFEDMDVAAVKTGMVYDTGIVRAIASALVKYSSKYVVCDPVMISTSGAMLIRDETIKVMEEELFTRSTLITPNIMEASRLAGCSISSLDDMRSVALGLFRKYGCSVLVKGGHLSSDTMCDILCTGGEIHSFTLPRVKSYNLHGTGCTLSSAIASFLARGLDVPEAVKEAKLYVREAISYAAPMVLGKGGGPLWHMYPVTGCTCVQEMGVNCTKLPEVSHFVHGMGVNCTKSVGK